nr:MAG TPA: hypothetical protein [Caudoviricetes sp.]
MQNDKNYTNNNPAFMHFEINGKKYAAVYLADQRETFDITIICTWDREFDIVGYYYGEPNMQDNMTFAEKMHLVDRDFLQALDKSGDGSVECLIAEEVDEEMAEERAHRIAERVALVNAQINKEGE